MKGVQFWDSEDQAQLVFSNISKNDGELTPVHPTPRPRRALGEIMNALPLEVLSEIFSWCTPTATDQEYSSRRFALTLSHVCAHWRTVALISPRLWTYTKLSVFQQDLAPALELMTIYLVRSKMLSVFIDIDFVDVWSYHRPVLNLFEGIVSVARQYRPACMLADSFLATHLEVSSTEERPAKEEWYFWSASAALPSHSPPALPESSYDSYMQLANSKPPTRPCPEPSVTIRALRFAIGSFVLDRYVHWAPCLTFLILKDLHNYTNLTTSDAAHVLTIFPLLVHCSLHIDFTDDNAALHTDHIALAHLRSFSLSWADDLDPGVLLDMLHAPALQELELAGLLPDTGGNSWDHLAQFLQRSSPPLTHLVLEKIDCFYAPLLPALARTPRLEGLWLEGCLLDDSVLRDLLAGGGGAPRTLSTLVLLECYAFDVTVLAQVLKEAAQESVRGGAASLVNVYVDGCGELTSAQMGMLGEMDLPNLEIGPTSMPHDPDDAASIIEVD